MNSMLPAAYPARLRRRHGAELITTMAEAAGPAGPTRADRRQLVLDGLRERFRLPPGRPLALVAAVLALLARGALGVAAYYSDDRLISITGWSLRPPTYVPLVIGGLALGLLAGWLTAAALAYRIAGARQRRTSAVTAGAGLAILLLPAVSVYRHLIRYLPDHESEGLNEFVHRALAAGPVSSSADRLNLGLGWTDFPWLNKGLVVAGLVVLVATAVIARPGRGSSEPAHPIDPQIAS